MTTAATPLPRPQRILFTIPNFVTAGSGQAMVNIIDRLDRTQFEPTVAIRYRGGTLEAHLEATGVPILVTDFTVDQAPLITLPFRAWKASRPFSGQYDIWHSFNWQGEFSEPLMAKFSGARAWVFTKKNMGWGSKAWMIRSLLANRIAVQNEAMTELFFSSRWLRKKVRYIPTGIDVEHWWAASPDLGLRGRLGVAANAVLIASVGNIQPGKNQATLVRALAAVPSAHLVLVGPIMDEDYANVLTDLAVELSVADRVHLIGPTAAVASMLKASDLFAFSSLAEGSPVAMLEAMAAGLPGVYSDIPGLSERIIDGVDGFLVGPNDVETMADRLDQLAASPDLRRSMGEAAHHAMEQHGQVDTEAARYTSLYLELRTHGPR